MLGPGVAAEELEDFAVRILVDEPRDGEGLGLRVAPEADGRGRGGGDFEYADGLVAGLVLSLRFPLIVRVRRAADLRASVPTA